MSFQSSEPQNIKTLFNGHIFRIPDYQRRYSWGYEQRQALLKDIEENIETSHFVGTLIFKKVNDFKSAFVDQYDIIDGQQRLTSIFFLLHALIENVDDDKTKKRYHNLYVENIDEDLKVAPQGDDEIFVRKLIVDFDTIIRDELKSRSKRKLYDAKREFLDYVREFDNDKITKWIEFIVENLQILLFNVESEAQAVRMFTVINDRGLPLSYFDKTKSILMLYSTQYLDNKLNEEIHSCFKEIFLNIDNVILLRKELGIFGRTSIHDFETTLYAQHYYTARRIFPNWDYQLGGERIFKQLKALCESNKLNKEILEDFIQNYLTDLKAFTQAYSSLFNKIKSGDKNYVNYFLYMEFTATLFPILVILYQKNFLDNLFDVLETIEMRVYKLRGTNPRSRIYRLSSHFNQESISFEDIRANLIDFVYLMNDRETINYLSHHVDSKRAFLRFAFYKMNIVDNAQEITLPFYRDLQVEHIFSKSPNFGTESYGWESDLEYKNDLGYIGNLTLLESNLNNSEQVNNLAPIEKAEGYNQSNFRLTQLLSSELKDFNREYIDERYETLHERIIELFPIPEE